MTDRLPIRLGTISGHHHPIRTAKMNAYVREDGAAIVLIEGAGPLPFFRGESEREALAKATEFRDEVIAKHEAAYVSKQDAMEKTRSERASKAAS